MNTVPISKVSYAKKTIKKVLKELEKDTLEIRNKQPQQYHSISAQIFKKQVSGDKQISRSKRSTSR